MASEAVVTPEQLRKDLEFVKRLLAAAKSVDECVAAAKAAATVAAKASRQSVFGKPAQAVDITIRNLPRGNGWNWAKLRGFLQGLGLRTMRADKNPSWDYGVARFSSEKDAQVAVETLGRQDCGFGALKVEMGLAPDYEESMNKGNKREREEDTAFLNPRPAKAQRPLPSSICEVVCPLWQKPYPEQLAIKLQKVGQAMEGLAQEVDRRAYGDQKPAWLLAAKAPGGPRGPGGKPAAAPLLGILRSPQIEGYRNKNELTVGKNAGGKPEVGFLMGATVDGITAVADPSPTRHTSALTKTVAHMVRDFLTTSKLPVWDKTVLPSVGFWRLVVVREGREQTFLPPALPAQSQPEPDVAQLAGQAAGPHSFQAIQPLGYLVRSQVSSGSTEGVEMGEAREGPEPAMPAPKQCLVMVQVNPKYANTALQVEELVALGKTIREQFAAQNLGELVLRLQLHEGASNMAPPNAPIVPFPEPGQASLIPQGELPDPGYIHDSLCELKFRISPVAFFQVNSPATCLLYKAVGDWAAPSPNTLLLDICCGTGTIGLTLAHKVAKVIGVDNVEGAVQDARHNASLNGITNCEYICGKAEDVMPNLLTKYGGGEQEVVAVADPPRAGLHKTVIKAILQCSAIKRLVFVSCNPDNIVENLTMLCGPPGCCEPKRKFGPRDPEKGNWTPFSPVKALAVDLFPHTQHVESLVLLERK